MGSDNDYFINSVKRSVLSFVLVNLFSLSIVFIFYPMIEKPENIFADRRGQLSWLHLRDEYYFRYFLGELTILILALFLGVFISSFILKSHSGIVKSFANPWFSSFMWLLPIFFLQLSDLEGSYDDSNPIYPYMILIVTFYTILIILGGIGSISLDEPMNFHIQNLLVIVKKRIHIFINLVFLLSYYLGKRSTAYYFQLNLNWHLIQDGVNLHIGILALSLQILILHLILSFIISRILTTNPLEVIPFVKRKNSKKSRGLGMFILMIVTIFFSLFLFFISIFPSFYETELYKWITQFLRNPYYRYFNNNPPSFFHWFGTDFIGQDIFSILFFSISAFLFISYIISLIRFRIALDFKNVTDKIIPISTRIYFYQILGGFPRIPILMLISILLFPLTNWLLYYSILLLIMSIISWVDISELLESDQETLGKNSIINKMFHPIILKSTSTILLDLIILSYLNVTLSNFPSIGMILRVRQYNMPSTYWWAWLFPIVIIAFTISLLRSNEERTNTSLTS